MSSPQQPLILQLIDAFNADILAKEERAFARMLDSWLLVEQNLMPSIEALTLEISLLDNPTESQIYRLERLQSLLLQTQDQIEAFAQDIADPIATAHQGQLARDAIDHSELLIRTGMGPNGVNTAFDRLPIEAVQDLIGISGDGSPLRATLERSYDNGAQGILNELLQGVARGYSPRKTAANAVRDGLSQSLSHMMTVTRTESLRSYRQVSRQAYQASNVVDGWVRVETLDLSTCPACLSEHGEIYELGDEFKAHPNCRGTPAPIVRGMPPIDFGDSRQYFDSLSEEDQRQIMGPGRLEYLQNGGDWDRLAVTVENDTWGGAVVPRPVRQL